MPNEQLKIGEKELGIRTWLKPHQEKDGWQNGGGAVTGYFSFDAKTNLVYYGTGNPGAWNPDVRPGDNKWASSVFARDVDTGQAKWAMQTTPHDEWDYDATNEVILFDKDKKTYATQINKNGFIYTWQADNGSLIAAEKVHPFVNWATSVDLKTGVPAKDPKYSTHQDYDAKGICPTNMGAKGHIPAAYSQLTQLLYIPLNLTCMSYFAVSSEYQSGQPWVNSLTEIYSWDEIGKMSWKYDFGAFAAINPLKSKIAWIKKEKFSPYGGVLTTSSNLVFYGTLDRWFKALDAKTGKELWKFQVGSGVVGNTFTYSHRGKQYVGVFSGLGGGAGIALNAKFILKDCGFGCNSLGTFGGVINHNSSPSNGTLNIFSL